MKDEDLIYLFTGTSEIFIKNRMNRIIQSFNKYEYTIIKYDMETTSLSTVLSDAITVPFLEELKIIILKNPKFLTKSATSTKDEIKAMLKYLKSPCDSTLLIIDATNTVINQSNEIYKMLKNVARIIDYPDPEEIELKGWIVRSFDANGIDIKWVGEGLEEKGYEVINFGTDTHESCNYPEYGEAVGRAVAEGKADCGVLICGTGVGISLAANKVPGVLAAVCSEPTTARLAKEHNNANIIAFGARIVGMEAAKSIVDAYLGAEFLGGRHQKRVDMIYAIEKKQ